MNARFPPMARETWIAVALAFVLGAIFGLVILGWWLWPVQWTNADPSDLNQQAKADYVVMVADSYSVNHNLTLARERLRTINSQQVAQILGDQIQVRNRAGQASQAAALQQFARDFGATLTGGTTTGATPVAGTGTSAPASNGNLLGSLLPMLLLLVLLVVLVAAGLIGYNRLRPSAAVARVGGARRPITDSRLEEISAPGPMPTGQPAAAMGTAGGTRAAPAPVPSSPPTPVRPVATAPTKAAPVAPAKSLGTFAATYKFGDDNYDTAFTLETAKGEFLGETGMGISETVGEGKPDKVTGFDLWLFDKTDVRTVTQILMSEHAFNDQGLRARLAQKGELTLAEKGKHILLETQTLRVDATIVDLVYASTPGLPQNSHFQKLIVEMVPVQK
ncbi:MAG: hypothetical protein ACM3JD_05220 [Rudaea sp.]